MLRAEIRKISDFLYLKIFIFLVVKFSIYLNRHVLVMTLVLLQRNQLCYCKSQTVLDASIENDFSLTFFFFFFFFFFIEAFFFFLLFLG